MTTTANRKCLVFAVLFVLLSFPHASLELNLFGGSGATETAIIRKKSRGLGEKKFKFHRIERISAEEEEEEEGENESNNNDDDGNENDEQDHNNKNSNKNNNNSKNKKNVIVDRDDDVVEAKRESRHARSATISSSSNEDEEFQFERVRRAQRDNNKGDASIRTGQSGRKTQAKDANKAEEDTFFDTVFNSFNSFFGFGADKEQKFNKNDHSDYKKNYDNDGKDDNDADALKDAAKPNGIIDWLKWLGEKTGQIGSVSKPPSTSSPPPTHDGWLSYLNRWPFNRFFPFDNSLKSSDTPRRTAKRRDGTCSSAGAAEPISQSHFESLLHTLPGFVVNASHVSDIECKRQMQIFHRQLRGNKLWALQMLDATGKISSGLLRGNINQFGDFDLCTQVKTVVKVTSDVSVRIRGKYCMAHIEAQTASPELKVPLYMAQGRTLWNSHLGNPSHFVPRYAVANWGICIPNLCTGSVVQEMIENDLRPYNVTGIEFRIMVNDNDCYTRQSKRISFVKLFKTEDNKMIRVTILSIGGLLLLLATSLLADYWTDIWNFTQNLFSAKAEGDGDSTEAKSKTGQELEQETPEDEVSPESGNCETSTDPISLKYLLSELFRSFSARRTLTELLSTERNDLQFPIVHLLKLSATLMLYMCLKYLMIGHLPITNRDRLVSSLRHPLSILFRSPMIYSDMLLVVSGFLSASQLTEEIEQRSFIHVLKRFVAKIMRYLPTVYLVLVFQTWLLPHLGTGPLWSKIIGQQANLCEAQMWRNVFSVQNAISVEETCSPMTIQLALEMQLYILGPLIVWLYYTDSDAGFFIYGAIHAMSVAARFSRTTREHLSVTWFHGMNISKFYRTANVLYSSPISRATPYLLGIGAGILQRTQAGEFGISSELVPFGWLLSVVSIIWCFWAPSGGARTDYIYSANEAAVYSSWSPLLLGLSLTWVVLMCPRDDQSLLHKLSTARLVVFLSRISFPTQLAAYVVVLYNTATVREASKYQFSNLFDMYEILWIIVAGTALAFVIDVPAQNIRRLLVERIFAERMSQVVQDDEEVTLSGTEQSEGDLSEERSENVACDTPEPSDSIWAPDLEKETETESRSILRHKRSLSQDDRTAEDIKEQEEAENTIGDEVAGEVEVVEEEQEVEEVEEEQEVEEVIEEIEEIEALNDNEVLDEVTQEEEVEEIKTAEEDLEKSVDEDDEEDDIAEDEEIKRRPDSHASIATSAPAPPPSPPTPLTTSQEKEQPSKSAFSRRRRQISEEN